MSLVTLSSEDCEMIEKCVDMISMQCKMIANMLRRSRDASGVAPSSTSRNVSPPETNEAMMGMLSNAVSTLTSTVRQVSSEMGAHGDAHGAQRKRARVRNGTMLPDTYDEVQTGVDYLPPPTSTPPPAKRRGRPPRDYGDELGPAFAVYANEQYQKTEQGILDRAGSAPRTRVPKNDVLRAIWDSWWLSSQGVKDKYLGLSRHEMAVNETHMLELLLDFPVPSEGIAAQAALRQPPGRNVSRSPEPINAFDMFLREQIPLLRSKVPDWNDAEIHRRLTVNWKNMAPADRERYNAAAALSAVSPSYHSTQMAAQATTPSNPLASRGYGSGHKSGSRNPSQSTPRRAYVLFCRQERPLLVQANPQWDLPTVNKELGRKWKELTTEQKEVFHDLERKESELRAAAAGDAYGAQGTPGGYQRNGGYSGGGLASTPTPGARGSGESTVHARSGARPGALGSGNPHKGPSKAYVFYSRLNRKGVTTEHPDWDLATVNRELGRMWKSLSLEERQSWESRAVAAAADSGSAASTPQPRASPAIPGNIAPAPALAPAATVTPSPVPATLSMHSENASASLPATPVSDTAMSSKDDVVMAPRHHDYAGEPEGEAEDVEMQDDDTEDDERQHHGTPGRTGALSEVTTGTGPPAAASPSSGLHGPSAAPVVLPKQPPAGPAVARPPPPTAKPAVITNGTEPALPNASALAQGPPQQEQHLTHRHQF
ncbi:hypothetical protein GGF46_002439 [Coemansia sp. RSA 552]|nr:hypothetical protein GGF46_002439 [Coemansia sp. RSA 552]